MELHDNRTEVERLLAAAWEYEHRRPRKTSLLMWLFALALSGAVLGAYALSHAYTAVMSALVTTRAKPIIDPVAAANVAEDIDYRIAQRTKSLAGWQAFLEAHRDGPHAQAAHAEIERLLPTPPPEPDAEQQAVATGKAEQRDALATAANASQVLDPKPIERRLKPQETEEVKAAAPIVSDRADSPTNAGVRAVEVPQMNGSNESSGVPLVKDEATPSGESRATVGRRVRRGTHHGGWHYRIHTTGIARMGPVLVFR